MTSTRMVHFKLLWILATTLALDIGLLFLSFMVSPLMDQPLLIISLALALLGLIVGASQWLVLRRVLAGDAGRWILASSLGFLLARVTFGLSIGIAQWLALPEEHRPSKWWLLFSPLTLVLGLLIGVWSLVYSFSYGYSHTFDFPTWPICVGILVPGLLHGSLTAYMLELALQANLGSDH